MATRGTIAVQHLDGTVSSVYSHWDSYPSWNGRLLVNHYNSLEMAEDLIAMGGVSQLAKAIDPVSESHDFSNPEQGVCVFYHRDRGEELSIDRFESIEEYFNLNDDQEFNYLFCEHDDKHGNRIDGWVVSFDNKSGYVTVSVVEMVVI